MYHGRDARIHPLIAKAISDPRHLPSASAEGSFFEGEPGGRDALFMERPRVQGVPPSWARFGNDCNRRWAYSPSDCNRYETIRSCDALVRVVSIRPSISSDYGYRRFARSFHRWSLLVHAVIIARIDSSGERQDR